MAEGTFLALIESHTDEIKALLPKYLTPERFFTLARMVEKEPNLRKCSPQSLLECVMKAAQCGLELGTADQHAFIIPYGNEATFQPSYRGLIFRLVQAGVVSHMYAETVCENDPKPEILSGTTRELIHHPDYFIDRGKVVGVYSVAVLPNGIKDFEVMGKADLEAIEKAALRISGGKPSPAWSFFKSEMQKKSVIKRHAKRLQGDRRGLINDEEATRLDMTFAATNRDLGETTHEDDDPPTPRKVKEKDIEIVKDKDVLPPKGGSSAGKEQGVVPPSSNARSTADDPITEQDQDALFEMGATLGVKASQVLKIAKEKFKIDDLLLLKQSQTKEFVAAMKESAG